MKDKKTIFTSLDVLEDKECNILCDQVLTTLRDYSEEKEWSDQLIALSGRLAVNLHNSEENEIANVVFVISDRELFDYHQANSKVISPTSTGVVNFKNKTMLYFKKIFIEIWFIDEPLEITDHFDLPLQNISQIPIETL